MSTPPFAQLALAPVTRAASRAPAPSMDERIFTAVYRDTARQLRGYLLNAVADPALADDLLQETYLRFLRSGFASDACARPTSSPRSSAPTAATRRR